MKVKVNTHTNGTTYFETEVGRSLLLRGFANDRLRDGALEKTTSFAKRKQQPLAFNASTFNMDLGELRGVVISDFKVVQNEENTIKRPYLIILEDGHLDYVEYDTTAEEMLEKGVRESLIGFFPLIKNNKSCLSEFSHLYHLSLNALNPQQIIYQKDGEVGFLTSNGRLEKERGLSVNQCVTILEEKQVDFAYLLDGGGSTSTVVNGQMINELDSEERPVADFIYIKGADNDLTELVELKKDIERLKKQNEVQRVDDIEKIKKTGDYWLARTSKGLPKNDNFAMRYTALSDEVGILVAYPFEDKDGTVYKNTRRSGKFRGWNINE